MPAMFTGGQPRYRAGDHKLAWQHPHLTGPHVMELRSEAFEDGGPIPRIFSGDGSNISPSLKWSGLPQAAQSLVLIVEDPDAPTPEPFVHWLLYNIPAFLTRVPENIGVDKLAAIAGGAMQGKNSKLKIGWTGMAPPKGDTPHRYFFQFFAVDVMLSLESGAGRSAVFDAMADHVIGRGKIMGTYQR